MSEIYNVVMGHGPLQIATLAAIIFTSILFLVYRVLFPIRYPKSLPRLGSREGISWSDMRKKYHTDCLAVFDDAYENVSYIKIFPNDELDIELIYEILVLQEGTLCTHARVWPPR